MTDARAGVSRTPELSSIRSTEVERVGRAFRKRYPEFQYAFVEFLTAHLNDLSRFFEGDLAEMLVFAVIGQVYLRGFLQHARSPNADGEFPVPGISASRIADVTSIPRETVRRKLESLRRRGWVEKSGHSAWTLRVEDGQSVARRDLHALDERGIERVAGIFVDLKALVRDEA